MDASKESQAWSPYVAGALTGLLLVFSVWFTGKYVGASTTFVRSAGFIERVFNAERVAKLEYFVKEAPKIDWQWMFVVGIFFGSLLAAAASKTFRRQAVPTMWEGSFGSGKTKRFATAFLGGAIAMFGARLADG